MATGTEVARAYVTIIPKSDGTSNEVINSVVNPLEQGVSKAGNKAGGLFNKGLGGMLASFTIPTAIIGALVGIGKAGFDAYEEVKGGANEVIKATGATGEAADELIDVYKDVAKSVVGDFDDIGAAVGELNTKLGITGEDLEYAAEQTMKFAQVNGVDAKDAASEIAQMMNNAGIAADEYGTILDKLTVAAQQSGVDVSTLTSTVNSNMTSFEQMGISTDEAIAMLAQFEKTGANTSAILAGMKKGVQNWALEGKSAKDGFAEFVAGVDNGTVTMQDAMELFGNKAGVEMYNAAQKGQLSFEDMFEAITENSSGALDQVYDDTLTASDKMDIAWKGVKTATADLFEPLAEGATAVLTNLVIPAIEALSDGISWLCENVPIWWDTYVAPVFDTLYNIFSDLPGFFTELWEGIKQTASDIWDAICSYAEEVWTGIKTAVMTPIDEVSSWLSDAWDTISSLATNAWDNIKSSAETTWDNIKTAVMTPINLLKSWLSGIWTTITTTAQTAWENIQSAIETPIENAKNFISGIIEKIKGFFSFEFSWPSLPLPHFAITPEGWSIGDLLKGSIPHLGIDWYARGGIFTSASVIGVGEAGREAVVPLQGQYMKPFAKEIAKQMENSGNNIIMNVEVNGAENPEEWAARLARELNWRMRMA